MPAAYRAQINDVLLSALAQAMGAPLTKFGDSTGVVQEVLA